MADFGITILFLAFHFQVSLAEKSAVLIYGSELPLRPVFPTVTQADFHSILAKVASDYTFLVFVEKELANFGCGSSTNEECFSAFPRTETFTFYHTVEDPILALAKFFKKFQIIKVDDTGEPVEELSCDNEYKNSMNTIVVTEKFEPRALLRFHKNVMHHLSAGLKTCKLAPLFFYLFTREINFATGEVFGGEGTNEDKRSYWVKGVSTTIFETETIIDIASENTPLYNNSNKEPIEFIITCTDSSEKLKHYEAIFNNVKYYIRHTSWPIGMPAPPGGYIYRGGDYKLRVDKLNFNVLDDISESDHKYPFPESYKDCKYITPGIISGLFVSAILGSILCWGIIMILDIRACDRFDTDNKVPVGSISE